MSDVGGGFWRGTINNKNRKIEIHGKLTPEQWEELVAAVRAIEKKYSNKVRVEVVPPPKDK
jgi:hypothetical protein